MDSDDNSNSIKYEIINKKHNKRRNTVLYIDSTHYLSSSNLRKEKKSNTSRTLSSSYHSTLDTSSPFSFMDDSIKSPTKTSDNLSSELSNKPQNKLPNKLIIELSSIPHPTIILTPTKVQKLEINNKNTDFPSVKLPSLNSSQKKSRKIEFQKTGTEMEDKMITFTELKTKSIENEDFNQFNKKSDNNVLFEYYHKSGSVRRGSNIYNDFMSDNKNAKNINTPRERDETGQFVNTKDIQTSCKTQTINTNDAMDKFHFGGFTGGSTADSIRMEDKSDNNMDNNIIETNKNKENNGISHKLNKKSTATTGQKIKPSRKKENDSGCCVIC